MKRSDINIRDPFTLVENGKYYMYGSRVCNRFKTLGSGFDVYESDDLESWSEPTTVFAPTDNFWSATDYWAPEVHKYKGKYYMFASFKAPGKARGTQILVSDSPKGIFVPHSDKPITPDTWECLDGTLYIDKNGKPYMVFCHEWEQVKDGEMYAIALSDDLKCAVSEPILLFKASMLNGVKSVKHDEDGHFVTDGPFFHRLKDGTLIMIWSSFNEKGYLINMAYSDNNEITGNWTPSKYNLIDSDGGHGMIFNIGEKLFLSYHYPNSIGNERPYFVEIEEKDGRLVKK